ncbi:toxin-antitoxin system HicB family antitoxin [Rhodoferax lithotrophicus]|uniref:toxin-antitoxin system HicB family antitoxin n=1 Tax=Rhodoferax lithotrophicus TaxID=2798804 RepID=UPI001CC54106
MNPPIVIWTFNGFDQHQETTFTVRVPNSVHESIKVLARQDGISVNQFIASAAAEKMASFRRWTICAAKPPWANARTVSGFCKLCRMPRPLPGTKSSRVDHCLHGR